MFEKLKKAKNKLKVEKQGENNESYIIYDSKRNYYLLSKKQNEEGRHLYETVNGKDGKERRIYLFEIEPWKETEKKSEIRIDMNPNWLEDSKFRSILGYTILDEEKKGEGKNGYVGRFQKVNGMYQIQEDVKTALYYANKDKKYRQSFYDEELNKKITQMAKQAVQKVNDTMLEEFCK